MPRKTTYAPLTRDQIVALTHFVLRAGRYWKSGLRRGWKNHNRRIDPIVYALRDSHGPSWLKGYKLEAIPPLPGQDTVFSDESHTMKPALRPYQQFVIQHIEEIVEQCPARTPMTAEQRRVRDAEQAIGDTYMQRSTAGTVDALKASCEPVAAAVEDHQRTSRFDRATAFLARFCTVNGEARREHIRFVLNVLSTMSDDDFAELGRIRQYLRGE